MSCDTYHDLPPSAPPPPCNFSTLISSSLFLAHSVPDTLACVFWTHQADFSLRIFAVALSSARNALVPNMHMDNSHASFKSFTQISPFLRGLHVPCVWSWNLSFFPLQFQSALSFSSCFFFLFHCCYQLLRYLLCLWFIFCLFLLNESPLRAGIFILFTDVTEVSWTVPGTL